jgi:hypothetical protein
VALEGSNLMHGISGVDGNQESERQCDSASDREGDFYGGNYYYYHNYSANVYYYYHPANYYYHSTSYHYYDYHRPAYYDNYHAGAATDSRYYRGFPV